MLVIICICKTLCRCVFVCFPTARIQGIVLTLWFMWFVLQHLLVMVMLRRAPKHKPAQTWVKSYLCTARTATCLSMEAATIFQVKALTCWSLTTPTHYGGIKLFTTGFITVPEILVYCLWMYNLQKIIILKLFLILYLEKKWSYTRLNIAISIFIAVCVATC